MNSRMTEQELIRRLAELPREISPRNDPWEDISARIESSAPVEAAGTLSRGRWFIAAAASVLIAVAASLLLGPMRPGAPTSAINTAAVNAVDLPSDAIRLHGARVASEAEYQAAFREFIPIGESRDSLPLKTVEMIELGWIDLTDTETVLAAALEKNPDNRFLNDRMLELRARQLGFLKQLARLDRNSRRMTI